MKDCTNPSGHRWAPSLEFVPKEGVMPVHCVECSEVGYHFSDGIKEKKHG